MLGLLVCFGYVPSVHSFLAGGTLVRWILAWGMFVGWPYTILLRVPRGKDAHNTLGLPSVLGEGWVALYKYHGAFIPSTLRFIRCVTADSLLSNADLSACLHAPSMWGHSKDPSISPRRAP